MTVSKAFNGRSSSRKTAKASHKRSSSRKKANSGSPSLLATARLMLRHPKKSASTILSSITAKKAEQPGEKTPGKGKVGLLRSMWNSPTAKEGTIMASGTIAAGAAGGITHTKAGSAAGVAAAMVAEQAAARGTRRALNDVYGGFRGLLKSIRKSRKAGQSPLQITVAAVKGARTTATATNRLDRRRGGQSSDHVGSFLGGVGGATLAKVPFAGAAIGGIGTPPMTTAILKARRGEIPRSRIPLETLKGVPGRVKELGGQAKDILGTTAKEAKKAMSRDSSAREKFHKDMNKAGRYSRHSSPANFTRRTVYFQPS